MCTCLQSDTGLLTHDFPDFEKDGGHYNCHPVKCRTAKGPRADSGALHLSGDEPRQNKTGEELHATEEAEQEHGVGGKRANRSR